MLNHVVRIYAVTVMLQCYVMINIFLIICQKGIIFQLIVSQFRFFVKIIRVKRRPKVERSQVD